MDLNLEDKVAIVTGGSRGLGRAVCLALAAEGARVAIHYYRNVEKGHDFVHEANEAAREIETRYGRGSLCVGGDMTSEADIKDIFRRTLEEFGKIDILVNNVGIWPTSYVKDMSEEEWSMTLRVNLTGSFIACREMVNYLLSAGRPGRIVNVTSQAAFHGSTSGHAHYAASKGGLVTFSVSLAREVAPNGIAVNAVAPGMMATHMVTEAMEERADEYLARIPMGRIGDPAEVANVIVFLASEKASYMTGATVDVTGGMLMR